MKSKIIKSLPLLVIVSLLAVSCGPAATPAPTSAPTQPPQPTSPPAATEVMGPQIDCMGTSSGDTLSLMYQWSGAEEESFNTIIQPFVDACGVEINAESTRDEAVLDTKAKSTPPDLLFWPTTAPTLLYTDSLQDMGALGVQATNYAGFWVDLGSVAGKWLAVPVKADVKSIIWYSPAQFDAFGYTVPTTFDELNTLVEQMVSDGNIPWSMGFESGAATGWTGSDFIQDLLLTFQGPDFVLGIIDGSVSYDDPGVKQAYEQYVKWASSDTYTVGGATGTVNTPFLNAIYDVFSDPPKAMMVKQSGFAGGEIVKQYPDLQYGTDFDFFGFPGAQGLQGGADYMMAFSDSPATQAMIAYLTGEAGAQKWAETGFSLSPNKLAAGHYMDPQLSKMADILANTSGFTPDLGDTIPAPFGTTEWQAIVDVVQGGNIDSALQAVAAAQRQGLALQPQIDCTGVAQGDSLSLLYQWSGSEEESFNTIIQPFVEACGVDITAETTRDAAVLDTKAKSTPPDVLFWPSTSPMNLYTSQLIPMDTMGAVSANYASFWVDLGTKDGSWLAVPVKADDKTIIWYSPAQFDAFGYTVPTTFDELNTLVEQMVSDGNVPWSMGFESGAATGWTGSDFIQDLLLTFQGPQYVMDLLNGTTSYDDAGVKQAYEQYAKWASSDTYTVGGATGTVNTPFLNAIYDVFSDPPKAMMVKQSGFAGGEIVSQYPDLKYGTDFDFFSFPGAQGLQGGSDYMFAFSDSAAAKALVTYLTSPYGASIWAKTGFSLSPNKWARGKYTDPQLSKMAEALATTSGFTPDLGDTMGDPFQSAEWTAIIDVVQGGDIDTALAQAAAAQAQTLGQ
jgi:alpha-glucoside transport system substrate-binding protein